ncbi:MAG: hypothetical protein HYV90_03905 [Candidatus Woesebacteria bacterium]|nr:MAG: hypothetical protein HYV90_03905 [Candidatus Woesebacteria bacterium]
MAGPVTHVTLAVKVFNKYFRGRNIGEFVIGTSLPDIRYLGVIDRDKSHFENIVFDDLTNLSSFEAGLKLHSLVDSIREEYLINNKYYSLFPASDVLTQAAKVFEDRLLYDKLSNWDEINSYFDVVYKDELNLGISEAAINKWHKILKRYFSHKSQDEDNIILTTEIGFPKERAEEMNQIIQNAQTFKAEQIVLKFYDDFESLLYNA